MDDLLQYSGIAQKVIVETAPITKGTFSDKEGKKRVLLEAEFTKDGEILRKTFSDKVENYIYHEGEMICLHVAKPDKTPIYKVDYFYEDSKLIKKIRVNDMGVAVDEEHFYYNLDGFLAKKKSRSMTYEYLYTGEDLTEERWHSDLSLNQIIKYSYENSKLTSIEHFSGEGVPGRKIEYRRENHGNISEEIIYSASRQIVSHFKYEYITSYKNNWLKRVKYTLHTQNKRKEASEVQYRDFKFYEEPKVIEEQPTIENNHYGELEFDNGIYKGQIENGQMHGEGDFIFNTGTRYKGLFKNNTMEGKGKLTYVSGKVYEGTFSNNMLEGPGACKWENGDFYVGEFKKGTMHGKGCYIWNNGNRFEGIFEDNKQTDQGILYKKSELKSDAPPEWVNELFK